MALGDYDKRTVVGLNTKHFAVAQFSRHIRPGMVVLAAVDDSAASTLCAWDVGAGALVVVAWNLSPAPATRTFDLAAFRVVPPGPVAGQWVTSVASAVPDPAASYTRVTAALPALSAARALPVTIGPWEVTTLEIKGVAK